MRCGAGTVGVALRIAGPRPRGARLQPSQRRTRALRKEGCGARALRAASRRSARDPARPAAPAPPLRRPPPSSFPMPARLRSVRSPPGPARARVGARCPETAPGESGGPAAQTRSPAPQRASVRGPRRMSADAVEGRRLAAHCDRLLRATAGPAGPGTPATARLQSGHRGGHATRGLARDLHCRSSKRSQCRAGRCAAARLTHEAKEDGRRDRTHRRAQALWNVCAQSSVDTCCPPPQRLEANGALPRFHTVWPPGHATRVRATRRHGRSFQRASQRGSDLPLSAGPVSKSQQELKHR